MPMKESKKIWKKVEVLELAVLVKKAVILCLSKEIRSDAIKIMIHKKKCESFNNCKIVTIENATNNEIKLAILKEAAQLKKKDLVKTKEKNSDVKLPKNF